MFKIIATLFIIFPRLDALVLKLISSQLEAAIKYI
jgi:hypothetical protein